MYSVDFGALKNALQHFSIGGRPRKKVSPVIIKPPTFPSGVRGLTDAPLSRQTLSLSPSRPYRSHFGPYSPIFDLKTPISVPYMSNYGPFRPHIGPYRPRFGHLQDPYWSLQTTYWCLETPKWPLQARILPYRTST